MNEFTKTSDSRVPNEIEEILGTILYKPEWLEEVKPNLESYHFPHYEWLYDLMLEVDREEGLTFKGLGRRCDINQVKVINELRKAFITELRLPSLINKVKEQQLARTLRNMAQQIFEEVTEANANEALREMQRRANELYTTDSGQLQNPARDVDDYLDYIEEIMNDPKKAYGLLTGISELDKITTGWHREDLIVVGARTSMGKSAFMIENLLRLHKQGYNCALFSLEMSKKQIYNRMMSSLMNKHLEIIRTGQMAIELLPKFRHTAHEALRGIYVDDTRGVDSEYISDNMRRLKRTQGLDFVVVDYLQDVKEKGESNDNQGSALGRICRKLRTAAQQNDCAVMALSQVSRAVEDRKDKRPGNADLSGSTGIETSADVIGLLYREEYYDSETSKKGILEVNFTKQRNGKLGKVELFYDKDTQRISPLAKR